MGRPPGSKARTTAQRIRRQLTRRRQNKPKVVDEEVASPEAEQVAKKEKAAKVAVNDAEEKAPPKKRGRPVGSKVSFAARGRSLELTRYGDRTSSRRWTKRLPLSRSRSSSRSHQSSQRRQRSRSRRRGEGRPAPRCVLAWCFSRTNAKLMLGSKTKLKDVESEAASPKVKKVVNAAASKPAKVAPEKSLETEAPKKRGRPVGSKARFLRLSCSRNAVLMLRWDRTSRRSTARSSLLPRPKRTHHQRSEAALLRLLRPFLPKVRLPSCLCAARLIPSSRAVDEEEEVDELDSDEEALPVKKAKSASPDQGTSALPPSPRAFLTLPRFPDQSDYEDDAVIVQRPPILPPKLATPARQSVIAAIAKMLPALTSEEEDGDDSDDEAPPAKKPRGRPPKSASKVGQYPVSPPLAVPDSLRAAPGSSSPKKRGPGRPRKSAPAGRTCSLYLFPLCGADERAQLLRPRRLL